MTRALLLSLALALPGCGSPGVTLALQIARKALEAASDLSSTTAPTSGGCQCAPVDGGADAAVDASEGGQ